LCEKFFFLLRGFASLRETKQRCYRTAVRGYAERLGVLGVSILFFVRGVPRWASGFFGGGSALGAMVARRRSKRAIASWGRWAEGGFFFIG
jgi:hypothetical protein